MRTCQTLGVPVQSGASQTGSIMGPAAFRTAGLADVLTDLGWAVNDLGDAAPEEQSRLDHPNPALRNLDAMVGWTLSLSKTAAKMARDCDLPAFREAHLIMELLHDSGLVTSLDLAELNPFLDERARTSRLLTDLTASLFGRRVLDRATRMY
jgi:arginase